MKWTFVVIASLVASLAAATPPALDPGTCTYLVGAPTGATAALDVETFEGTAVTPTCLALYTVSTRATETNSVQLHFEHSGLSVPTGCFAKGWVGHEFLVTGPGRSQRSEKLAPRPSSGLAVWPG